MNSELKQLLKKHREEIENLRNSCQHKKSWLKIRLDSSQVGAGSLYPSVHVICRNCGTVKVIFRDTKEMNKKIKKTLKRQGFKDERLDLYTLYEYELD